MLSPAAIAVDGVLSLLYLPVCVCQVLVSVCGIVAFAEDFIYSTTLILTAENG